LVCVLASAWFGACRRGAVSDPRANQAEPSLATPLEATLPAPEEIAEFVADPIPQEGYRYFKDFKVDRADMESILTEYFVIESEAWHLGYSHIALNDCTGHLLLKNGSTVQWMVRPGGLARLEFASGARLYLAKERKTPRQRSDD
jgi:hypothetical protein